MSDTNELLDQDDIRFVCDIEAQGHTRDDFCVLCQDVEEGEWKCWNEPEQDFDCNEE